MSAFPRTCRGNPHASRESGLLNRSANEVSSPKSEDPADRAAPSGAGRGGAEKWAGRARRRAGRRVSPGGRVAEFMAAPGWMRGGLGGKVAGALKGAPRGICGLMWDCAGCGRSGLLPRWRARPARIAACCGIALGEGGVGCCRIEGRTLGQSPFVVGFALSMA